MWSVITQLPHLMKQILRSQLNSEPPQYLEPGSSPGMVPLLGFTLLFSSPTPLQFSSEDTSWRNHLYLCPHLRISFREPDLNSLPVAGLGLSEKTGLITFSLSLWPPLHLQLTRLGQVLLHGGGSHLRFKEEVEASCKSSGLSWTFQPASTRAKPWRSVFIGQLLIQQGFAINLLLVLSNSLS